MYLVVIIERLFIEIARLVGVPSIARLVVWSHFVSDKDHVREKKRE